MLASIGSVAMNSGHASMAVQQLAETMTGTGLIYFILQDATLGAQLKNVLAMVERATTNEWIDHPPMDTEVRDLIIDALKEMQYLVSLRNRVVHDVWAPAPTAEYPTGIYGFRATRWSKSTVNSTVGSLNQVASAFFLVACTLGAAERALIKLREKDGPQPDWFREDVMSELKGYHGDLVARCTGIKSGQLQGWRWATT
jgi:hypothetical protein